MTRTLVFTINNARRELARCEHDSAPTAPTHDHCVCLGHCDTTTALEARLQAIRYRNEILAAFTILNPEEQTCTLKTPETIIHRTAPPPTNADPNPRGRNP